MAIVLNQDCDLAPHVEGDKPVVLARVREWSERLKGVGGVSPKRRFDAVKTFVKPSDRPNLFYLKEHNTTNFSLPRSVADLLETINISAREAPALKKLFRLRLSPETRSAFQERLRTCYGRIALPDNHYFDEEERQLKLEADARKRSRER